MSARNAAARLDVTAPISAPGTPAPITDLAAQRIRARRRRELNIYGLRVLVAVIVLGVVIGVLLGRNRLLADVFSIYIKAANAIPRVVLGALFAISLGLDIRSKVATAAILVFFVVFFNAFQGVREVERNLIANARILGADDRRLTTEVIVPSALSWIIASLHISFGLALVGAVVGELFGATQGVGELIYSAEHNFNANGVFAGMLLLAAMALLAEAFITA